MIRIAYLITHPIQYQAPLLRRISQEPHIDLTVFFRSDLSVTGALDQGFGIPVKWDINLLSGYRSKFLPVIGNRRRLSFWRPLNYGLAHELRRGGFDALWVHGYGSAYHLYALLIGRILGLKVLLRDEVHHLSRRRSRLGELRARLVYVFLRRVVDCFLVIGSANAAYYRSRGVEAERVVLMPYAVDNDAFAPIDAHTRDRMKTSLLQELGITGTRTIILFAAKLQKRKRCADLLEAFLSLDPDRCPIRPLLIVVGDGEERRTLEARIEAAQRGTDVRFLGFVNQSALPRLYQAGDIFVLPSHHEAWGLAINEAMSAGCAIIASSEIGAVPDLVVDGVNGYTFAAGDVTALAAAIGKLMHHPERTRAFGATSRRKISSWKFEADVAGLRQALGLGELESS